MTLITRRSILAVGTAAVGAALFPAVTATAAQRSPGKTITVGAGESVELSGTTRLSRLTIAEGGRITAPDGRSISLTVDGVETGQALTETGGSVTLIQAGTYRGDLVLAVTEANDVAYEALTFPFRQALYVGAGGVDRDRSVLSAVTGGRLTDTVARDVSITSTGECFDAVFVQDGTYTLRRPTISLTGNGRCDFVGYGAAVVGDGPATTVVVDGARIRTRGVVRTAVVSSGGANVVVKDSTIQCRNGVLPDAYEPTVDTPYMQSVPWMLGLDGNVRATNLIGDDSRATYLNSTVFSETWGALSVEGGSQLKLTVINSHVGNTGEYGYGTYAIADSTVRVLGSRLDVGSYATICAGTNAVVHYGDSTSQAVAGLNTELELGLSDVELKAIPARNTVVNSGHFGYMFFGPGTLTVDGGTVVNSERATFLNKGQRTNITVDGSRGVRLRPRDGVILQMMELDDPGPVVVDGKLVNQGVYTEPTTDPVKDSSFDVTVAHDTDGAVTLRSIALKGDFYNGMRSAKNMVLTLAGSSVEGVISSTRTAHRTSRIDSSNFDELGIVTNTVGAAVNNGTIVKLDSGSTWTVTGISHLTALTLAADAAVKARHGRSVTLTVDGTVTAIEPGTSYHGALALTVR
ncbi:hypothetical protein [Streptomyces sp. NPDC057253]|uniref:hypothetical protein n=1 Tax=Streptomyces sp. NPDC057253 TaxID=3346069 RepID=UPI0036365ED8